MISPYLFFILFPISAIITLGLAIFGWYNRKNSISESFILLMVGTTIWTTGDWLNTLTHDPALNYVLNSACYPAVVAVPMAWFLLVLFYTGYDHYLTRLRVGALFIIPAIAVLLVLTNPIHHLYYTDVVPEIVENLVFWHYYHGYAFFIIVGYLYLLPLVAFLLIIGRLFGPTDIYRRQTLLLFLAAFIPFSSDILYVMYPGFYPTIDYTPFSFTLVGILVALGIIRYQLFSSVPLAYASLFSSMHDGVFATDSSFQIIDLNPAARQICGWSSKDAIGTTLWKVMPAIRIPPDVDPGLKESRNEGRQEIVSPDGTVPLWYEVTDFPLRSGNRLTGWIFTVRDITGRKQIEELLKESQEKLQLAIDGSHIGIWEYHIPTATFHLSQNLYEILGYSTDHEMTELGPLSNYLSPEDNTRLISFLDHQLNGKNGFFESDFKFSNQSGEWRWISFRGKVVASDKTGLPLRVIGTAVDISERRNALESLKIANYKLNLLSSITRHDILNQVTGLQAYLDFALEEVTEGSAYRYLKKSKAITRTIQSQIEFTRIYEDIGVRSPKWQDLYLVIEKVIGDLAHVDLKYHLNFSPILVYADPLLEKVFFTLVENTVRHGEKATDVWFSYELLDSHLIFLYEDNGIGVRMEDKDQIFLKHFGKNTGFGLFIALDILAITGISIRELGIPGKGVRFEIIIPEGKFRFPSDRELSRD